MKITIEMPEWVEVVAVTASGSPCPTLNVSTRAWAVKDGDTVKVQEVEDEGC